MKNDEGEYVNIELGGHNINDGGAAKNLLLANDLKCETQDDIVNFENGYVFYNNRYYTLNDLISESFLIIMKLLIRR